MGRKRFFFRILPIVILCLLVPLLLRKPSARFLFHQGRKTMEAGKYADSLIFFRAAAKLDSSHLATWLSMGNVYFRLANKEVHEISAAFMDLIPGEARYYSNLVSALRGKVLGQKALLFRKEGAIR